MKPIPDYQTLMLPVLACVASGQGATVADTIPHIARHFGLGPEEIALLKPSGRQTLIANRIHWSRFYMRAAGLLASTGRGSVEVTPRGLELLRSQPTRIDNRTLEQYPEFLAFKASNGAAEAGAASPRTPMQAVATPALPDTTTTRMTPEDRIHDALADIDASLRREVLERLFQIEPPMRYVFFERLVLDLMQAMGYGEGVEDAAQHTGKAGDGGVDGMVKLDALGFDRVYIQAKCHDPGSTIGAPDVQAFFGALAVRKTTRGVFLTTASFSKPARDYVAQLPSQIILIDGEELTRLMLKHRLGFQKVRAVEILKVDEDYFEP